MALTEVRIKLTEGTIGAYVGRTADQERRSAIVFLHGLSRRSDHLFPWYARLGNSTDILFIDLPGHGNSDPMAPTLEQFSDVISATIDAIFPGRRLLIVGESLGGLVALQMSTSDTERRIAGVMAVDPPLATKKQPHIHGTLQSIITTIADPTYFQQLGQAVFGFFGGPTEDRIYYDLIGSARCPISILTGDAELFPMRSPQRSWCCLDGVDRYIVEQLFSDKATFHRKEDADHLLLINHEAWCEDRLRELAARADVPLAATSASIP